LLIVEKGCRANTQLAFQYLQKAAEHAVDDLNNLSTVNLSAAKGELVMAIYELGVSFRHGWGVQKDKKTACYYFKIAAELVSITVSMFEQPGMAIVT
jgi:hypothetical protein